MSATTRELNALNPQSRSGISILFLSRLEHEIKQVLSDDYLHVPIAAEPFLLKLLEVAPDAEHVVQGPLGVRLGLWAIEKDVPNVLGHLLDRGLECAKKSATSYMSLLESSH